MVILEGYETGRVEAVRDTKAIVRSDTTKLSAAMVPPCYKDGRLADVGERVAFHCIPRQDKAGLRAVDVTLDASVNAEFVARFEYKRPEGQQGYFCAVNAGSRREYTVGRSTKILGNFRNGSYVWAEANPITGEILSLSNPAAHGLNNYGIWLADAVDPNKRRFYNLASGAHINAGEVNDFPLIEENNPAWDGVVKVILSSRPNVLMAVPATEQDLPKSLSIDLRNHVKSTMGTNYGHIRIFGRDYMFLPSDLFGIWMRDIYLGMPVLFGTTQDKGGLRAVYVRPKDFKWDIKNSVNQHLLTLREERKAAQGKK